MVATHPIHPEPLWYPLALLLALVLVYSLGYHTGRRSALTPMRCRDMGWPLLQLASVVLLAGYAHHFWDSYHERCARLMRDSFPPPGCFGEEATLWSLLHDHLTLSRSHDRCAAWNADQHKTCFPNPAVVLTSFLSTLFVPVLASAGEGSGKFTSALANEISVAHFFLLAPLLLSCACLLVYLAPWLCCFYRRHAPPPEVVLPRISRPWRRRPLIHYTG